MDAAVKQRFYTGPNGQAQFWNGPGDCGHFYATNPRFNRFGADVRLESQGDFEVAIPLGGQCMNATSWDGDLVATSVPWISGFMLKFRVTDVDFYGTDGNAIGGGSFGLIKAGLINEFGDFSYDLRPQLRKLQALTQELPPAPVSHEVEEVLASLRPIPQVIPRDEGLEIALQMDVPESWLSQDLTPLTAAQKTSWQQAAENVSGFLTTIATRTGDLTSDPQLRREVADVATDARARIAATEEAPPRGGDPIPLFRDDWQRLRLALTSAARRGSLGDQTTQVLAALIAGDLLFELGQRVPELGSQLSRAGLQELARTLP